MEVIRDWALTICITAIGGAIFSILTPNNNSEKLIRFVCCLFFLSAVISPIITNPVNFDISSAMEYTMPGLDDNALQEGVKNQTEKAAERVIYTAAEKILHENSIKVKKIEINININEDNSILINRLAVHIDEIFKNNIEEIKDLLEKEVGIEPEIIVEN